MEDLLEDIKDTETSLENEMKALDDTIKGIHQTVEYYTELVNLLKEKLNESHDRN